MFIPILIKCVSSLSLSSFSAPITKELEKRLYFVSEHYFNTRTPLSTTADNQVLDLIELLDCIE